MMMRLIFPIMIFAVALTAVNEASAQPTHPDHRYMVSEHTAFHNLWALVSSPFRPVRIIGLETPEKTVVGEDELYSLTANVETASLPISVQWDFGDGTTAEGLSVRHAFAAPGEYEVTVRIRNGESSDTRTFMVRVDDARSKTYQNSPTKIAVRMRSPTA